uniref:Dynein regulatory complex subunit 3 n=1 Tax=Varanus komodoensis TaxID=61221 RepID=A0A8D2LVD9_VARKO
MSRLYDSIEPNVIDEEMLQRAVEEQGPREEAGLLAKKEGINFRDVKELQLDFRNILKIDNLWQFVNLTKLQLDNNIIEKIESLECLVNLVWLDLSFNNIEIIEGLDTLVKLQDLSLFNNRISKIENLDALQELQVFSIGNNAIQTLENMIYLRKFKNLRTLNLAGNPVCENEVYAMFIAAHLPDLVYLDFRLVEDNMVLDKIQSISDTMVAEVKLTEYNEDIAKLTETLMTLEMQLVEQLEVKRDPFWRIFLGRRFVRNRQRNYHHEKLLEIAISTLEKIVKRCALVIPTTIPCTVHTIVNAVNASHDIHLLKIDNREDEIITKANGWASALIEKVHKDEIHRNRSRVMEINQYVDHLHSETDSLDILEQ